MSVADAPPAGALLERAEALVPLLREKAHQTEAERRVPDDHFDALAEAGVFRMCAPKLFGGYEADFRTQIDVLAAVARGCPSTSWVSTIFSAVAWLASCFPDEAQEEILGDGDPRASGVFAPVGSGVRVGRRRVPHHLEHRSFLLDAPVGGRGAGPDVEIEAIIWLNPRISVRSGIRCLASPVGPLAAPAQLCRPSPRSVSGSVQDGQP